jgi:AraC family transcriptional regulator
MALVGSLQTSADAQERNMSIVDKAVWVIERNSEQPLTLNAIANACAVSRSHLAFAFGAATGMPVMKYVRGRRLSEAAETLAKGGNDILSIALEAGYGSHEAFTRAFREQFSVPPENVRQRASVDGLPLVTPVGLMAKDLVSLDPPRLESAGLLRVVGMTDGCSFETTVQIPRQWQRFMTYYDAIPAKLGSIPVGLAGAVDAEGRFSYTCGVEVSRFGDVPKELLKIELLPRDYAVFEHKHHVSKLYDTYSAIWNTALPSTGRTLADAPVIERHNPQFDPRTGEGGIALWVPLE